MDSTLKAVLNRIAIDRPKTFSWLKVEEKESITRICRFIGDIISYNTKKEKKRW